MKRTKEQIIASMEQDLRSIPGNNCGDCKRDHTCCLLLT